jgi:putative nucleotidyltransferase with HDIG domain
VTPHPPPHAPDATALAPRSWWIAPPDLQIASAPAEALTTEEAIIELRVARQTELGHFRIPQMPAVAARAVALLARPEADSNELSRLIHEDQQLAADVISFSNSSLFAGATKNTNIPQAISRVGFRRTRSLIFAASLRAMIYSGAEIQRADMLWRHSCGCAAISACIAKNLRCNADDLYLAGLFHDVGKTVVLALVDTIALRSKHVDLRPSFVERVLAMHHERVGVEVARRWELPEQVVEAVSDHGHAPNGRLTRAQAIVALANNSCRRLGIGETDDGRPIAHPAIFEALRIGEDDLPRVLDGVTEAAQQA